MFNYHHSILTFFILLLFVFMNGCASVPRSINMDCDSLKLTSITKPDKQFDLVNYSVRLPKDSKKWCIASSNIGSLVLFSHPLMGKFIEKPSPNFALNTIGMIAMEVRHGAEPFENTIELKTFVENWIHQGFGIEGEIDDLVIMQNKTERFSLLKSEVKAQVSPSEVCVNYDYVMRETDNPRSPNQALIVEDIGLVCQHENLSSHLVVLSLSERYPEGYRIDPNLFSKLKENVAPDFFGSLNF